MDETERTLSSLVRMLAIGCRIHPEELAMYILSLTVQSSRLRKPLPFKPSGGGLVGKARGLWKWPSWRPRRDRNRRDDREGGRDFNRKSNKIAETLRAR